MTIEEFRKDFPLTYKVLDDYGKQVVKEIKANLDNTGSNATGTLKKSIQYDIIISSVGPIVEFYMADYGKWVDEGRKPGGKMPPLKKILEWTSVRGIDSKYAFPIARKIAEDGIRPTNFFSIPTSQTEFEQKKMNAKLEKAMSKDIENNLAKDFE